MPGATPTTALHGLILELFDTSTELRSFLGRHVLGPAQLHLLPDPSVGLAAYALAAIRLLETHALLDGHIFAALVQERPRRGEQISRVQKLVLDTNHGQVEHREAEAAATAILPPPDPVTIIRLRDIHSIPLALEEYGIRAPAAGCLYAYPEGSTRPLRLRSTSAYIQLAATPGRGSREVSFPCASGGHTDHAFSWGPFHGRAQREESGNWVLSFQDRRSGTRRNIRIVERETT